MKKSDCFYGIYPIRFIWHGTQSDPEIMYKKHLFNYYQIEDYFWNEFTQSDEYWNNSFIHDNELTECFSNWTYSNRKLVKEYLNELIEAQ